jgi:hypothetical protein
MGTKTLGIVFLAWMQILLFFTIIKSLQVVVATNVFLPAKFQRTFVFWAASGLWRLLFQDCPSLRVLRQCKIQCIFTFLIIFLSGYHDYKKKE